jgi:FkbM family methyltransferase
MGNFLMKTVDYFGWTVLEEDDRYGPFTEQNIDVTNEDTEEFEKIINEFVPVRDVVLDVGCHYGFFTRWLSKKFNRVHAFDFNNDVFECFQTNMKNFSLSNVEQHPYGLGDRNATVGTNDRFKKKNYRRGPLGNHIDLNSTDKKYAIKNLDSLNIENVNVMMIDTEGFEYYVLKGAEQTIKKYRPILVVEFHTKNLTKKFFNYPMSQTEDYLDTLGYRYVRNLNKVDRVYVPKEL